MEEVSESLEENINNEDLVVYVPKKYVSAAIGPKKINKIYFEQKYGVKYIVKGED